MGTTGLKAEGRTSPELFWREGGTGGETKQEGGRGTGREGWKKRGRERGDRKRVKESEQGREEKKAVKVEREKQEAQKRERVRGSGGKFGTEMYLIIGQLQLYYSVVKCSTVMDLD